MFFTASIFVNAASFILVTALDEISREQANSLLEGALLGIARGGDFAPTLIMFSVLVSVFDLFSAFVTWRLLNRAARSARIFGLATYIAMDIALAIGAGCWAFVLFWEPEYLLWLFVLGVSASLPTVAYLPIVTMLVVASFLPASVTNLARRVVFLVTSDKKPVLSQLGTFFGGLAAILVAFTRYFM